MRMWMVNPSIMCQKHLCGEHVEIHMFLSHLKVGKRVDGYIKNNCLEMKSLFYRHKEISEEMIRRGYNHSSEMTIEECDCINTYSTEYQNHLINKSEAISNLISRCENCSSLLVEYSKIFDYQKIQKDIKFLLSFVPDWLFDEIPKNIDPTFYISGSYVNDLNIQNRINEIINSYKLQP